MSDLLNVKVNSKYTVIQKNTGEVVATRNGEEWRDGFGKINITDKYDTERFTGNCPTCSQPFYKEALEKAVAFIDSNVGDPDITTEMCYAYREYKLAIDNLTKLQM